MEGIAGYLNFIREKGRPLAEINPGSSEMGLKIEDALKAIELLKKSSIAILGGDVLSDDNGDLIYAYQYWGDKYIYLNWYCDKESNESRLDYCDRSYQVAKGAITEANRIADQLGKRCFIVIVI